MGGGRRHQRQEQTSGHSRAVAPPPPLAAQGRPTPRAPPNRSSPKRPIESHTTYTCSCLFFSFCLVGPASIPPPVQAAPCPLPPHPPHPLLLLLPCCCVPVPGQGTDPPAPTPVCPARQCLSFFRSPRQIRVAPLPAPWADAQSPPCWHAGAAAGACWVPLHPSHALVPGHPPRCLCTLLLFNHHTGPHTGTCAVAQGPIGRTGAGAAKGEQDLID